MASVEVPGELTPDERNMLDFDMLDAEAVTPPPVFPTWALLPDQEDSGFATEIDVPFAEDVMEGAGGDDGPAPSGMFSEEGSAGADAIAHYKPWHVWGDDWGIYFFANSFRDFVSATAKLAGAPTHKSNRS